MKKRSLFQVLISVVALVLMIMVWQVGPRDFFAASLTGPGFVSGYDYQGQNGGRARVMNHNGEQMVLTEVNGDDPTAHTADLACAKLIGANGLPMVCKNNVESFPYLNNAGCKLFHPAAATRVSTYPGHGAHGGLYDIYCSITGTKGAGGTCSQISTNTCTTCPQCAKNLDCGESLLGDFANRVIARCYEAFVAPPPPPPEMPDTVVVNGTTYYEVDFDVHSTMAEACAAVGKNPGVWTSNPQVCTQATGASVKVSTSGDRGVAYCDGDEMGECGDSAGQCLSCPACSVSLSPYIAGGNLYGSMWTTCGGPLGSTEQTAPPMTEISATAEVNGSFIAVVKEGETGSEVCAQHGKVCLGYANMNRSACKAFYPDAATKNYSDGGQRDFFCQSGSSQTQAPCSGTTQGTCGTCVSCQQMNDCEAVLDGVDAAFAECEDPFSPTVQESGVPQQGDPQYDPSTGLVEYSVTVTHPDDDPTKVRVQYTLDSGSTFEQATIDSVVVSAGTADVDNDEDYQIGSNDAVDTNTFESVEVIFTWDTAADGLENGDTFQLRISVEDTIGNVSYDTTNPVDVDDSPTATHGSGGLGDIDGDGIPDNQDDDRDGDGILDIQDSDIDGDGIPNGEDDDADGNGVPDDQQGDLDGDGIPNEDDADIDGDGIPNGSDDDVDGDGIPNGEDTDVDGDGVPNVNDPDVDGDGTLNGQDNDVDGDGVPNGSDPDVDGDGTPNGQDNDVDGDGAENGSDSDVDGDGVMNGEDSDVDGDGVPNGQDTDVDGDGTQNGSDDDVDGDGVSNGSDGDIDGDGLSNGNDSDIDGDGVPNGSDGDIDGDGAYNGSDDDVDGDGSSNGNDGDVDGDGVNNVDDDDIDGDGIPNNQDTDIDGDGVMNGEDDDVDGDGVSNGNDGDVDGDGTLNDDDDDVDGDGTSNEEDDDVDGDGTPNVSDSNQNGSGLTEGVGSGSIRRNRVGTSQNCFEFTDETDTPCTDAELERFLESVNGGQFFGLEQQELEKIEFINTLLDSDQSQLSEEQKKALFDSDMSRAEAMEMLVFLLYLQGQITEDIYTASLGVNYLDVPVISPFYQSIALATVLGIVQGYPNGTFAPFQAPNLAETARIAVQLMALMSPEVAQVLAEEIANEKPGDAWYQKYLDTLARFGVFVSADYREAGQFVSGLKLLDLVQELARGAGVPNPLGGVEIR